MSAKKEKLNEEIKAAMKAREKERLMILRGLSAAIKQYEVDNRSEADDATVVTLVQKEIKKCRDALEFAEKEGRQELIDKNKQEIEVLQEFLDPQLSREELEAVIQKEIDSGADSIGPIMGKLNASYKGQFEGKVASGIIKEKLG